MLCKSKYFLFEKNLLSKWMQKHWTEVSTLSIPLRNETSENDAKSNNIHWNEAGHFCGLNEGYLWSASQGLMRLQSSFSLLLLIQHVENAKFHFRLSRVFLLFIRSKCMHIHTEESIPNTQVAHTYVHFGTLLPKLLSMCIVH